MIRLFRRSATRVAAFGAAFSAMLAVPAGAADIADVAGRGAWEYRDACASCHGAHGEGDGPLGALLKVPPPDLTRLSARNGGDFPYDRVFGIIDGRYLLEGHGTSEMPVWGRIFRQEERQTTRLWGGDPELLVAGRIHALVVYLKAIQGGIRIEPRPPARVQRSWPEGIPRPQRP